MEPAPPPEGGAPGQSAPSLPVQSAPSLPGNTPTRRKRVRFVRTAKNHDGLWKPNEWFEKMMKFAFRDRRAPLAPADVLTVIALNGDLKMLAMMMLMLLDLIARCEENGTNRTVVLPRGGGTASMVTSEHLPYMRNYVQHIEKVIQVVTSRQASQSGGDGGGGGGGGGK
jgi:hypothetical protein